MLETIFRMLLSLKLSASEPRAAPVRPMIPEMSPRARLSFLRKGFPALGSTNAMVFRTCTVPLRKGLMNRTSMGDCPLSVYAARLLTIFSIFSLSTSAVKGLTM